ncbi:Predicted unusual protein kinase regulating ubiquinone biosynthesis, AarF/ABC1/UbiB family [Loktanella fryxellensis]|uniref:Predicted unusual protein kinase regulating ubiquinone biosynthesis, AarF/ABC1/UbiB family n=1 Tax=Loktanella fryxellensis TaxID=245187 RepID=A0A1H8GQA5_9RHOB|nr:AarF/ABC1/UbiB kinase family protein [Loktanella fryxellensis]SEN45999.1 Predicted unusual protein kinase regulating ubiquinone biosynthesis, AarF/ABC1/UbiB family [Loktanella fryxellensis]
MSKAPTAPRPIAVPTARLTRLAGLGAMTAGVAGAMLRDGAGQWGRGQRPAMRDLLLTPANITRIADQLAKMRGAAMKIGQMVSMDTGDVLPPELAQIMARLRDSADTMPPAQLRKVLDAQWPKGWLSQFRHFDVRPIASASIGQVHRAQLRDGTDLAIKVQYPGVARSIDSDVANVGALIRMTGLLPKGLDIAPYLTDAARQLHEETDYAREAAQMTRYAALIGDRPGFAIPQVRPDWSTPQVLAMTYVAGQPIEAAVSEAQDVRDRIARDLIALTLDELWTFGVMQTDPNFANYRWQADTGRVVLLDFGAAGDIDTTTAQHYRDLLRAGLADDMDAAMVMVERIGFIAPDAAVAHRAQIAVMMAQVFARLRDPAGIDFADTSLSRRLQAQGMQLAEDGFIPPPVPIAVLLVQRKLAGMFLLAARLGARVDVHGLLADHLGHA